MAVFITRRTLLLSAAVLLMLIFLSAASLWYGIIEENDIYTEIALTGILTSGGLTVGATLVFLYMNRNYSKKVRRILTKTRNTGEIPKELSSLGALGVALLDLNSYTRTRNTNLQRKVRLQRRLLRAMVNMISHPIGIYDGAGNLLYGSRELPNSLRSIDLEPVFSRVVSKTIEEKIPVDVLAKGEPKTIHPIIELENGDIYIAYLILSNREVTIETTDSLLLSGSTPRRGGKNRKILPIRRFMKWITPS